MNRTKKAENDFDRLLQMSWPELYPYICFLILVVVVVLYNLTPLSSLLAPLIEFQYNIPNDKGIFFLFTLFYLKFKNRK